MPADMETVQVHKEDVAFDMKIQMASEVNIYDFGYGLNYKGIIKDLPNNTYQKKYKITN